MKGLLVVSMKNYAIVLFSVGLCLGVSACSGGEEESRTFSTAEMVKEQEKHRTTLVLPAGAVWTDLKKNPPMDANYEVGSGLVRAEMEWQCIWQQEYLKVLPKDASKASQVLKTLAKVKTFDSYINGDPSTKRSFDNILAEAELGNTKRMVNDVDLNCKKAAL